MPTIEIVVYRYIFVSALAAVVLEVLADPALGDPTLADSALGRRSGAGTGKNFTVSTLAGRFDGVQRVPEEVTNVMSKRGRAGTNETRVDTGSWML